MHAMAAALISCGAAACTHGPVEESTSVSHLIRLGDSYRAVVVVRHQVFRRPTGINTFPNGGVLDVIDVRASEYLLDVESSSARLLASQPAPDSLFEGFAAYVAGVEGDSLMYIRLHGCPRGGECYPGLENSAFFRLDVSGDVTRIDRVPADVSLPGSMLAPDPGERHYVRFSRAGDTIRVRRAAEGPWEPMFVVHSDGTITSNGG